MDVVIEIQNLQCLKKVLKDFGINIKGWGKTGPTKSVKRLWGEINRGDCILLLRDGKLVRRTWRSQAMVFRKRGKQVQILTESQTFANGHHTPRDRPVSMSEKYRPSKGETALEGMLRGFREELKLSGIAPEELVVLAEKTTFTASSRSYPTLASESIITCYRLLLKKRHWRPKYVERGRDKVTVFLWSVWNRPIPKSLAA